MTEQLIQTPFGEFFAADNDLIAHHLATHGAHNISDLQVFLSFIRYGDTVVDIGAHIGAYAVAAAKKAGPRGAVIAFEGFAPTFEFLQRNIRQNDLNIKPVFGIVDNAERAYAIKFSSGNTGATRFNSINDSTPTIPVITNIKDHVETPVDVVKIDVEGMEANVLDSITDILRTDKPVIMIEISRVELAARGHSCEEIGARLKSLGYRFFLNRSERTKRASVENIIELPGLWLCGAQVDILCIHEDSTRLPAISKTSVLNYLSLLLSYSYLRARILAAAKRILPDSFYNLLKRAAHSLPV